MKKTLLVISIIILSALLSISVNAHPGRTDSSGGHTNHSTGEYHYHHGYSAHEHYDMDGDGDLDCPYDFKDKTNHNSSEIYTTPTNQKIGQPAPQTQEKITLGDVLMAMLECIIPAFFTGFSASYLLFHLFYLIWGKEKGCSISLILFSAISVIAYIWFIFIKLS